GRRSCRDRLSAQQRQERVHIVACLELEDPLLERLERPACERGVLAELLDHLIVGERVLGSAELVGQVALERRAVLQGDPHAAGEAPRVRVVLARLVAHLAGQGEYALVRQAVRRVGAEATRPCTSIAAVEYWSENFPS